MCGDCQRRAETNPLRVLDCKVRGRPADHRQAAARSSITSAKPAARISTRCSSISTIAGSNTKSSPRLVRGLDYYMRTTFEVVHGALGAQNSVLGGGRYDGLAESLGSKVPRAGHRIFDRRRPAGDDAWKAIRPPTALDLFIAPLGEAALRHAARAGARLPARRALGGSWREGKLKRAMELANKLGARFTLIVGDNEMAAGRLHAEEYGHGRAGEADARRNRRAAGSDTETEQNRYGNLRCDWIFWATFAAPTPAANCAPPMPARPSLLMGWVHRRRDHGRRDLRRPARPRRRHPDGLPRGRRAGRARSAPKRCAPEYVIAVEGKVEPRAPGDRQPEPAPPAKWKWSRRRSGF